MEIRNEAINLLIVDDHAIIRRGLRAALRQHWPNCVVEEAATIGETMAALGRHPVDLVLLDLHMGDRNAIDILEDLCAQAPRAKVLVFSMSSERVFSQLAMARGAHGFVSKAADERDLIAAMERLLAGGDAAKGVVPSTAAQDPFSDLSDRELRVMHELLTGAGVKIIAARLALQPSTVATYKARLFDKLGVGNILDLRELVHARNKSTAG